MIIVYNLILPEDGVSPQITVTILFVFFFSSLGPKTLIIKGCSDYWCLSSLPHAYVSRPWECHWMVSFQNLIRRPRLSFTIAFVINKRIFFNWLLMLYHMSKWVEMWLHGNQQCELEVNVMVLYTTVNNISVDFHYSQIVLHDLTF